MRYNRVKIFLGGFIVILEINGKELEFHFGVRFIREMDARFTVDNPELQGLKMGFGLEHAFIQIQRGDRAIYADILYCAQKTSKRPHTESFFDDVIDNMGDDEFDDMAKLVIEAIAESNSTKKRWAVMATAMK